jgi:hypothetical protein
MVWMMMEPFGDETVDRKKKERTKLVLSPPPPNQTLLDLPYFSSNQVLSY